MTALIRTHWRKPAAFLLGLAGAVGIYLVCAATWKGWAHDHPVGAATGGAALTLLCTFLLQRLGRLHNPHGLSYPPKLFLVVLLGGLGIHWTGTAVEHWLMEKPRLDHHHGKLALCGFILAAAAAAWGYAWRHLFTRTRTYRIKRSEEFRPHLIWFLSAPPDAVDSSEIIQAPDGWELRRTFKGKTEPEVTPLRLDQGLGHLIDAVEPLRWHGQQLLRALNHHTSPGPRRLRQIWIVASPGPRGSSGERDGICRLLRSLPALNGSDGLPPVIVHPQSPDEVQQLLVDYEEMDHLQELVASLVKDTGRGKDLTIDCTGGQKTTSIAAAIATVNNHALVQYVETQKPINVLAYNCVTEHEMHAAGEA